MPRILLSFFISLTLVGALHSQSFQLVSWNIQYLGKTKSEGEIEAMAKILKDADLVVVQEVVAGYGGPQAVGRLAEALNRTGAKWDYRTSDPTQHDSKGISERYAFLFKTSSVQLIGKPYLEPGLTWSVAREPYAARFLVHGDTIRVINFHARPHDKSPEIETREVLQMARKYQADKVIFAGDWNMNEEHEVFRYIHNRGYRPVLRKTRTTLKKSIRPNGAYFSHAIDNIWYHLEDFLLVDSEIIDLVQQMNGLEPARELSDHVPVAATFSIPSP